MISRETMNTRIFLILSAMLLMLAMLPTVFADLPQVHNSSYTQGMAIFFNSTGTPAQGKYKEWNGTNFSDQGPVWEGTGNAQWVISRANPYRDRKISLAVYENASNSLGVIVFNAWNGTHWLDEINLTTSLGTSTADHRVMGAQYIKDGSGRAMVVFSNATADAAYAIWNGTGFEEYGLVTQDNCTGTVNYVIVSAGPNGTMYEADLDSNGDFCAHAWNGTH